MFWAKLYYQAMRQTVFKDCGWPCMFRLTCQQLDSCHRKVCTVRPNMHTRGHLGFPFIIFCITDPLPRQRSGHPRQFAAQYLDASPTEEAAPCSRGTRTAHKQKLVKKQEQAADAKTHVALGVLNCMRGQHQGVPLLLYLQFCSFFLIVYYTTLHGQRSNKNNKEAIRKTMSF